jgi:MioC protein
MHITIIFGTETGNAEILADDIKAELQAEHTVVARNMNDCELDVFDQDGLLLAVVSTYGDGELPSSAHALYAKLEATRPALEGVRFAIFGLGDSQYKSTFGHGSKHFENMLVSLGAHSVGERSVHDASGGAYAEDQARTWLQQALSSATAD